MWRGGRECEEKWEGDVTKAGGETTNQMRRETPMTKTSKQDDLKTNGECHLAAEFAGAVRSNGVLPQKGKP